MAIVGEADSGCSEEDEKWKVLIGCFRSLNKYKEVLGVVSSYKKEFRIFHCKIVSKGIIEVGEISFPIHRSPLGYADQIQKLIQDISVHLLKLSSQKPDETVPDVFTSGKDYVSKECEHFGPNMLVQMINMLPKSLVTSTTLKCISRHVQTKEDWQEPVPLQAHGLQSPPKNVDSN